jgi:FKBP-type peptidyl-prolyl cis-trans isomerase
MKKKIITILAVFLAVFAFWGCKKDSIGSSDQKETFDRNSSYALGLNIGMGLKDSMINDGIYPNLDEFLKGMKDGLAGRKTRYDEFEAREIIETAFQTLQEQRFEDNIKQENAFLAENSKNPGVIVTPSGLQYEVLTQTYGPKPSASDTVKVHYEGRLVDGTMFDNSYERHDPVEFPLDMVITGWSEGIQLMSVGSKYKFYIPSEIGYGREGRTNPYTGTVIIPPYAPLVFTVELIEIVEKSETDNYPVEW